MRRIFIFFTSLLLILSGTIDQVQAQDTLLIPLKIKVGLEASGPAIYVSDKNILNTEGYIAADLNEKVAGVIGAGYLSYKYSQYNYEYLNKGIFVKAGADFNLLKPEKSLGKYWAGIGLRYGISVFNSEIPSFKHENAWGTRISSVENMRDWGHFIEVSPGVRAEIFRNISIGWTVNIRKLLFLGTGKDLRPVYFPGYGNGSKSFSTGLSYFLVWNIPFKKIKVITKPEVPEESDDTLEPSTNQQTIGSNQ
ncbi:MAG TPA: DUF6048 family protein [Bacteroidales bacterium]|nr:DUF6048 family protein [Bacteroidales bacterium]